MTSFLARTATTSQLLAADSGDLAVTLAEMVAEISGKNLLQASLDIAPIAAMGDSEMVASILALRNV